MSHRIRTRKPVFVALLAACCIGRAFAHEVRPAFLEITERANGHYDVLWKQPTMGEMAVHLAPRISGGLLERAPSMSTAEPSFQLRVWQDIDAGTSGLEGRTLSIEGLSQTITAFTVAHSITLAATALHMIAVRPAVIEALVALSILFVAVEVVHSYQGREGLTVRYPWLIAFTFGLLHGAAFAGALAEIGLPPHAIPLSLFLFNVGVEIGQLIFIGAVLALAWALRQLPKALPGWMRWVPPYAIGVCAAYWFIDRVHTALV